MKTKSLLIAGALTLGTTVASTAQAVTLRIAVENLAPMMGTITTPVWIGIHDGSFDLGDPGTAASAAIEAVAEVGDFGPLTATFSAASASGQQQVVFGPGTPPVLTPGDKGSVTFDIDPSAGDWYLSYAAMVLPSNDAFFANLDAQAIPLFSGGQFVGSDFVVSGSMVYDAGTEVNDEVNAPLLAGDPAAGTMEGGVIMAHSGFIAGGNILGNPNYSNADFTIPGYALAYVDIAAVPVPPALGLFAAALGMLCARRRA